jgi:CubicO group peptidase (beta-lactamase class C family)
MQKQVLGILLCLISIKVQAQKDSIMNQYFKQEVIQFMDSIAEEHIGKNNTTGIAYALVQNGALITTKGHGLADIDENRPFSSETSFRIASVTKLFTATAVMQLHSKGLVELDRDIRHYLPNFNYTSIEGDSLTLLNLLTHTGGFEDKNLKRRTQDPSEQISLEEYLYNEMPKRVAKAGETFAYSNHGLALAGLIVEKVSGKAYCDFVQTELLSPLKMVNSTFDVQEATNFAKSYKKESEEWETVPYDYIHTKPSSMLISTAADMARFMNFHLQADSKNDGILVSDASFSEMHHQQFTHHPQLPGVALGFFEAYQNGLRLLRHGGTATNYGSFLCLIPEKGIGIFITHNGGDESLSKGIVEQFINRFFPDIHSERTWNKNTTGLLSEINGEYIMNRFSQTTIEKLNLLFAYKVKIEVTGDSSVSLWGQEFKEIGPLLFENTEVNWKIGFGEDQKGEIAWFYNDNFAYKKLKWFESVQFSLFAVAIISLLFLFGLIRYIVLLFKKDSVSHATAFFNLLGLLSIVFIFIAIYTGRNELQYQIPMYFYAIFCLPLFSISLGVFSLIQEGQNLQGQTLGGKVNYLLHLLVFFSYAWFMWFWNLIGFNFG